jgi:hypothetical protein
MSDQQFSVDPKPLRLSVCLLMVGIVLTFLAGTFHPDHAPANDHAAAFLEYAGDSTWTATHLGQFAGMAVLIAGVLVLASALDLSSRWAGRFGMLAAVLSLGVYGVLQAVDGVALKHAVDAWANAPEADKSIHFAVAEGIRWLEWAVRSYQSVTLGLSFILIAAAILQMQRIPGGIGILMGVSGLAYLSQGWVLGLEGFSANNSLPTLSGILSIIAWCLWLGVHAMRMKGPSEATGYRARLASD